MEKHPPLADAPAETHHLVTTYFDTADRALDRCGLTLRVRIRGEVRVQTVKSRPDGQGVAAVRGEWEWLIDQETPDLAWLASTKPLADIAATLEGRLQPVFSTDVHRTTRIVPVADGVTVEVAFDEGTITAGTAREPINEMELELKSGDVAGLYHLAATLQSLAPLALMSDSKSARGWHLRTGEWEGANRACVPKLARKVSAIAGFRQLLGGTLGHLTANIGPTLRGDPEGLHQSRIAIRDTRALLRLFGKYLDDTAARGLNARLRNVAKVLGAARDWDVFCLETLPAAGAVLPTGEAKGLLAAAEAKRKTAHKAVAKVVRGPEYSRMIVDLMVWVDGPALVTSRDHGGAMQRRLSALAPSLLHRSAARVLRRGRHVGRLSASQRHSLRKSLKKLSCDARCLGSFFGRSHVKSYLRHGAMLEKVLGAANDAVVAEGLLGQLSDLAAAISAMKGWNKAQVTKALHDLKAKMRDFRHTHVFWQ